MTLKKSFSKSALALLDTVVNSDANLSLVLDFSKARHTFNIVEAHKVPKNPDANKSYIQLNLTRADLVSVEALSKNIESDLFDLVVYNQASQITLEAVEAATDSIGLTVRKIDDVLTENSYVINGAVYTDQIFTTPDAIVAVQYITGTDYNLVSVIQNQQGSTSDASVLTKENVMVKFMRGELTFNKDANAWFDGQRLINTVVINRLVRAAFKLNLSSFLTKIGIHQELVTRVMSYIK